MFLFFLIYKLTFTSSGSQTFLQERDKPKQKNRTSFLQDRDCFLTKVKNKEISKMSSQET